MAGVGVWKEDGSAHLAPPCSPEVTVGPTGAEPVEQAPILPLSGGSILSFKFSRRADAPGPGDRQR